MTKVLSPLSRLWRRVREKPFRVLLFRAGQESRLAWMEWAGSWKRLEAYHRRLWDDARVAQFLAEPFPFVLIHPDGPSALRHWLDAEPGRRESLFAQGEAIRRREFDLLGVALPRQGPWPWHVDWRCLHSWPSLYFNRYDFYAPRSVPFDVKVPWELGRLGFLLPLLQNAALDASCDWIGEAHRILLDWENNNPLAFSINWNPMQSSMRTMALVLALEMMIALGERCPSLLAPFVRQIALQGEFLHRTLEYTDIRGNHYTANLVALLLTGLVLERAYPPASRWVSLAERELPRECELQFLPDGVNFEKTTAYHVLVTELFLTAALALQRRGFSPSPVFHDRLRSACRYTAACLRPDGKLPIVGDNDNARVFTFDPFSCGAQPFLTLAASHYRDAACKTAAGSLHALVPWLLGEEGVAQWNRLEPASPDGLHWFQEGGVVIARGPSFYFFMDVGEVGMQGRGGHGHNDLASFELGWEGVPLIIDQGCPVYTADLAMRDRFRSTFSHNTLAVDHTEIAPLLGTWRIGDQAQPRNVSVMEAGGRFTVRVAHEGYRRLPDPLTHTRTVELDPSEGILRCEDYLETRGSHRVDRFLHFDPRVQLHLSENRLAFRVEDVQGEIDWPSPTSARLEEASVSPAYGVIQKSKKLVLSDTIQESTRLEFVLRRRIPQP